MLTFIAAEANTDFYCRWSKYWFLLQMKIILIFTANVDFYSRYVKVDFYADEANNDFIAA